MTTTEMISVKRKLFTAFDKAFINSENEFIANPRTNSYFSLNDCKTEKDVQKKILHWLSGHCEKAMIHTTHKKYLRSAVNKFMGTNFSRSDFLAIHVALGFGTNKELTDLFIDSGFDMALLRKEFLDETNNYKPAY